MAKITRRLVEKIQPDTNGKDQFIWESGDGALKGFGIRIKPTGIASYIVQYRNKESRTRRMAIGKVNVLTPDEARKQASEILRKVDKGGDPSAERHALNESATVSELCDLYLEWAPKRVKKPVKPSTLATDRIRIESHVKPLLGPRKVIALTRKDIEKFQNDVAAGKTAQPRKESGRGGHAKGGKATAARTVGMLITILEYARKVEGIIKENPGSGVEKIPGENRDRVLSLKEIASLGKAMRESKTESKTGIAAIRALLLTGCRKNEILALPWEWVDTKASCFRFADTKTGAQLRPIGYSAVKLIETRSKNNSWVFPADRGTGHFIGAPRVFERLCEKAGIENASLHTLRHTFASHAAALNYSQLTIAGLLGHKMPGMTARYVTLPDSSLVAAADRVSQHIADALDGKQNAKEKVVQIRGRK